MWSFALLGALLLLFPGFCCLAGMYYSQRAPDTKLSGIPDIPLEGPIAISFVIGGALAAHLLGAWFFFTQESLCSAAPNCTELGFDPNPYTTLIAGHFTRNTSGAMVVYGLSYLALLGAFTGWISARLGETETVKKRLRPTFAFWLHDLIRQASEPDKVVVAYVVTNLGHEGSFAAYEGVVEVIKLGRMGDITSVSLSKVDRFSVRIGANSVTRSAASASSMSFFHITNEDISNLSFQVVPLPPSPKSKPPLAQSAPFWPAFWAAFTLGLVNTPRTDR